VRAMSERVVVVRRAPGYRTLIGRLTLAFEKRATINERRAYMAALVAISEFLRVNENPALAIWLLELASTMDDLNSGITRAWLKGARSGNKSLPSSDWRRFAAISVGIEALRMCNVSRNDAADQALRAVKAIKGTKRQIVLSRYDELQKKRAKNEVAAQIYSRGCEGLKGQTPDKLREMAKKFFQTADLWP
jgi:hypothetical protein